MEIEFRGYASWWALCRLVDPRYSADGFRWAMSALNRATYCTSYLAGRCEELYTGRAVCWGGMEDTPQRAARGYRSASRRRRGRSRVGRAMEIGFRGHASWCTLFAVCLIPDIVPAKLAGPDRYYPCRLLM